MGSDNSCRTRISRHDRLAANTEEEGIGGGLGPFHSTAKTSCRRIPGGWAGDVRPRGAAIPNPCRSWAVHVLAVRHPASPGEQDRERPPCDQSRQRGGGSRARVMDLGLCRPPQKRGPRSRIRDTPNPHLRPNARNDGKQEKPQRDGGRRAGPRAPQPWRGEVGEILERCRAFANRLHFRATRR